MSRDFDEKKFELIDKVIENGGDVQQNQIPQALTTVISQRQPAPANQPKTQEQK
jgi:hypothetical protein